MSGIKSTFKVLFLIGTLVLILGFVLVWIPESGISGLKEQLSQTALTSEKVGLEKAISTENMNLVTLYQPVSSILQMVGGIVIAYSVIITAFSLALENRSKLQLQQSASQSELLKFYPRVSEKAASISQEN